MFLISLSRNQYFHELLCARDYLRRLLINRIAPLTVSEELFEAMFSSLSSVLRHMF